MNWFGKGKRRNKRSPVAGKPRRGHFEHLEPRVCLSGFAYQLSGYSTLVSGLPILNSRPSAPAAIYMCFVGDPVQAMVPYSTDSDPATFNAGEQADIYHIWQATALYYSMFDINVTTIQPGTNGSPNVPMGWLTLTSSISSGGATITIEGFPDTSTNSYNGAWDTQYRYTGGAHELGHDLGLNHQGTYDLLGNLTATYSSGADALHGAMMGGDYSQQLHKWLIGHPNANQGNSPMPTVLQDDMAVIANTIATKVPGYTGDGYSNDNSGSTFATAVPLTFSNGKAQTTGVIDRLSDVNMYSFSTTGGRYSLSTTRAMPDYEDIGNSGSQVDLKVTVYDSAGNIIAAQDGDPIAALSTQTMVNNQFFNLTLGSGTYYVAVSSHGNYDDQGAYNLAVNSLPSGWSAQNLGNYAMPGAVTYDQASSTFTVSNVSFYYDYGHSSQQYELAYQTLQGDGTIIAKVNSWQQWKNWGNSPGQTGLTIRNTLDPDSTYAIAAYTSSSTPWLKLVRSGSTFTTYSSANGTTWTSTGSSALSMNATAYIGLATWAGTGVFSNVSVTAQNGGIVNPTPTLNGLSAPTGLAVTAATTSTIGLSWTSVSGATGYAIERSSDGDSMDYVQIGTTPSGTTAYTDSGLLGFQRYFYRVRAQSASAVSAASSVVNQITRANAATGLTVASYSNSTLIVNWTDASGETGYRLERSINGTTWNTVTMLAANVPSYTDTGRTSSTQYYYRVVTLDAGGDAAVSNTYSSYTRPDAVASLTLTSNAENQVAISWSGVANAINGYHVYRASQDHGAGTLVGAVTPGTTTFVDANTPIGRYLYFVAAYNPIADGTVSNTVVAVATPASTGLPSPWVTQDFGSVGYAGATKYSGGTLTMVAGGNYLLSTSNTSDQFRFTYQPLSGDCSIVARVTSVDPCNPTAPAGVMIRSSVSDLKSPAAYLSYAKATAGNGTIQFGTRLSNTVAATVTGSLGSLTVPYWEKLVRTGNNFSAYVSADGSTWTQVGSAVTIAMGTTVYAGMAGNCPWQYWWDDHASPMTFDNIGVTPSQNTPPTVAAPAAAAPSPATGTTTALSVLGADDGGEASLTYFWATTGTPPANVGFSANATNAAKDTTVTFSRAGNYSFTVTITDLGGRSASSSVNVTVTQTVTSIAVSPPATSLTVSGAQQFAATAYDQFGAALSIQPSVAWTAVYGSITAGGFYTAPSTPGSDTVTARAGSASGTAAIAVGSSSTLHIVSWQSIETHGNGIGEVGLSIPDDGTFSEPRGGGIQRLLVTFSEAVDPTTFTASNVAIAGNGANGTSLNLTSIAIATALRNGNTVGVIDFSPALPDVARYQLRVAGITDLYGTTLPSDDRVLSAVLGDVSGDGKVDTSDMVMLGRQYTNRVNPANASQVRADYNMDGRVNVLDLTAMWNQRNHDATQIPTPLIAALAAARVVAASPGSIETTDQTDRAVSAQVQLLAKCAPSEV
jgi:hypothetical protein